LEGEEFEEEEDDTDLAKGISEVEFFFRDRECAWMSGGATSEWYGHIYGCNDVRGRSDIIMTLSFIMVESQRSLHTSLLSHESQY
jgi:hypothetical protein